MMPSLNISIELMTNLFTADQKALPESVEKWLETLRLGQYLDTFVSHKYDTMMRVIKLWELELNTVGVWFSVCVVGGENECISQCGWV